MVVDSPYAGVARAHRVRSTNKLLEQYEEFYNERKPTLCQRLGFYIEAIVMTVMGWPAAYKERKRIKSNMKYERKRLQRLDKKLRKGGGDSDSDEDIYIGPPPPLDPDFIEDMTNYQIRCHFDRFRGPFHRFMSWFTDSTAFSALVLTLVFLNTALVALETYRDISEPYNDIFFELDIIFVTLYSLEFMVKLYAEPIAYWYNPYNRFDVTLLVLAYLSYLRLLSINVFWFLENVSFLRVLRALRALRALRSISFVRPLQVLVNALFQTIVNIINLLILLVLIIYVFAVTGYNLFGAGDPSYEEEWGTLEQAMLTLFAFTTADGWTGQQGAIEERGIPWSREYVVVFIFVGNIVFTNLFIGVIIQNLQAATDEDDAKRYRRKKKIYEAKKASFLKRKAEREKGPDLSDLKDAAGVSHQEILRVLRSLSHEDLVPMRGVLFDLVWFEAFMGTLRFRENALYRVQQLHFNIADTLGEVCERKLETAAYYREAPK